MINAGIRKINKKEKTVSVMAPVFPQVDYYFAKPIKDYKKEFKQELPKDISHIGFSCNCLLNFMYCNLEGHKTADITGPMTFGEIAYLLLNQTMVYLQIDDI